MYIEFTGQNSGAHFLGRGFSNGACDSQHGYRKLLTVKTGDALQRGESIRYAENAALRPLRYSLHKRAKRPFCKSGVDIIMAIHPFPPNRRKKTARRSGAAIRCDIGDFFLSCRS